MVGFPRLAALAACCRRRSLAVELSDQTVLQQNGAVLAGQTDQRSPPPTVRPSDHPSITRVLIPAAAPLLSDHTILIHRKPLPARPLAPSPFPSDVLSFSSVQWRSKNGAATRVPNRCRGQSVPLLTEASERNEILASGYPEPRPPGNLGFL